MQDMLIRVITIFITCTLYSLLVFLYKDTDNTCIYIVQSSSIGLLVYKDTDNIRMYIVQSSSISLLIYKDTDNICTLYTVYRLWYLYFLGLQ